MPGLILRSMPCRGPSEARGACRRKGMPSGPSYFLQKKANNRYYNTRPEKDIAPYNNINTLLGGTPQSFTSLLSLKPFGCFIWGGVWWVEIPKFGEGPSNAPFGRILRIILPSAKWQGFVLNFPNCLSYSILQFAKKSTCYDCVITFYFGWASFGHQIGTEYCELFVFKRFRNYK